MLNLNADLSRALRRSLGLALLAAPCLPTFAAELGSAPTNAVADATLAIKQFKVPAPFKVDLFAAEPQLRNPVAFCFDEQGRVYVSETFRYRTSVYDIREHMNMFDDDLAARTVEDRAAMIHKFLGNKTDDLAKESEVVQLIEDRDGDGKADHSTVFADGFNTILDGIASGVLARKGNVYFTDIPNLWLLQDTNHDGKADVRNSLSHGYGVHFNLTGHDLHGLTFGPDGRLYFSIGDRSLHVKTKEGKILDYPDMGAVLRCNPDGSGLEVFAYGVRNPQELAFDDHGNLFSGDNNCDHGDSARLINIVEGGDSGWRIGNQFSETTPAGVWNSEKLWHLQFPGQAAYIIPPVAHIGNGPSGLAHYPGTGFPDKWKDHFFMCDFRGSSANSGIHSFAVEPDGAGFKMVDHDHFWWSILVTDVDFSPDGRMFAADWVQGWPQSQKGRLYRLYDTNLVNTPLVLQTKKLINEGMEKRSNQELAALLAHPNQHVRQEAQFELESRATARTNQKGKVTTTLWNEPVSLLGTTLNSSTNQLARIHAIWAIGNIARKINPACLRTLEHAAGDSDPEIRAQIARVLGDAHADSRNQYDLLVKLLTDASPRVQFFAAISLGKLGNLNPSRNPSTVRALFALLRANADKDVYVRHAAVMGLTGLATKAELVAAAKDASVSARMGAALALRRLQAPEIAAFLKDSNPLVVLEAARAINDVPITDAQPQLAALITNPTGSDPLDWRVVNANFRLGAANNAAALATLAAGSKASEKVRGEALHALETWAKPSQRERLTGLWRPLAAHDAKFAADALRPVVAGILSHSPEEVQVAALRAAKELSLTEASAAVFTLATDIHAAPAVRVEALKALEQFHDAHLGEAVQAAVADKNVELRKEGQRLLVEVKPAEAVATLAVVLDTGSLDEKQGALVTLGTLKDAAADKLLASWLDKLISGEVPKEIRFDLIEAAGKRDSDVCKAALQKYNDAQPKDDEFAGFRDVLYGGDAEAGKKIFLERPEASCTRCHRIKGQGGEAGPELTGIIKRQNREYILESILYPNKKIAPGFENVMITTKDGQSYAGILKSETADELVLISPEDGPLTLKKANIQSREKGQSGMPEGFGNLLSKRDIRNLVEFLSTVK